MNDDLLTPKSQPAPAEAGLDASPNDTEEQDTVSDRVFDFTDGDIKPVADLDGPVTHSVNLKIAEALRNPAATIKPATPQQAPKQTAPTAKMGAPANKPTEQNPAPKPIPHPPIDMSMQAPAVRVYSQIPHPAAPGIPPKEAQQPQAEEKPSQPTTTKTPSNQASAPQSSLQDILNKVHNQTQATPPAMKENLLDKNIGNFDSTPFKNRNVPSNPPTKVIDARPAEYASSIPLQQGPRSLQDEIGSTLPSNLKNDSAAQKAAVVQGVHAPTDQFSAFLKPMRTYEGDVAEMMSHKKTSVASIALAETKKAEGAETLSNSEAPKSSSHALLKMLMALLILALLGGGVFGAYYLYSKSPLATSTSTSVPQQQQARTGIVRADTYAVIVSDNQLPATILNKIQAEASKPQKPGSIREIALAHKNPSASTNSYTQISAAEAIKELDVNAPDMLTRTLTPEWMLGIYASPENEKGAFVIVTTNFFQNAFAGMLQWESVMADDLKLYLNSSQVSGIANTTQDRSASNTTIDPLANLNSILPIASMSTSSATSTKTIITAATSTKSATSTKQSASTTPETVQPLRPYFTLRGRFEDRIIKNKDVRAFRTETGSILFLYSFIDNIHLAIASDEATLTEVLTRLEKQASIR